MLFRSDLEDRRVPPRGAGRHVDLGRAERAGLEIPFEHRFSGNGGDLDVDILDILTGGKIQDIGNGIRIGDIFDRSLSGEDPELCRGSRLPCVRRRDRDGRRSVFNVSSTNYN